MISRPRALAKDIAYVERAVSREFQELSLSTSEIDFGWLALIPKQPIWNERKPRPRECIH
jgi:hypothetical protein